MASPRTLLLEYPAIVHVGQPLAPHRLERIEAALAGIDHLQCVDTLRSPPEMSFRFRREADVTMFQNRLAQ